MVGSWVRVKATTIARLYGVRTHGQFSPDNDRAWPGEIGQIQECPRAGCYSVWFSDGRELFIGSVSEGPAEGCAAVRPALA